MATDAKQPSLNEASERDPYNNNSYGTLVDDGYKQIKLPVLDVTDFNERIIRRPCFRVPVLEAGARDLPVFQGLIEVGLINNAAATDVHHVSAILHPRQVLPIYQSTSTRSQRYTQ